MKLQSRAALLLAVALTIVAKASAHGGVMHSATHNETSVNVPAGSCSSWVALPATSTAAVSKLARAGGKLLASIDAEGFARMTVELEDNCTDAYTTRVLINVTLTDGSKPLVNASINGSVNTGKCSAGGGSVFIVDTAEAASDHNKVFFKPIQTAADGSILGSFASDGIVRVSGSGSAKSIVLYSDGTPIVCCDLTTTSPPEGFEAALAAVGRNCTAGEQGDNQLGMLMDGKWMRCSLQINGSYWMKHGDEYSMCLYYQNGTKASADTGSPSQVGMVMDNVWQPCKLYINGSYWMMHDTTYARCIEYRNGTTIALGTAGGSTHKNSTGKSAAGCSWLVLLLLLGAAVLGL